MLPASPKRPGTADLCFSWRGSVTDAMEHLRRKAIAMEAGPIRRFGARGWGESVYCRDLDGNLIELICYQT